MPKLLSAIRSHRYLAAVFVVMTLGIATGITVGLTRRTKSQSNIPTVVSHTPAVRVAEINPRTIGTASVLSVKLQNVSGRDIKMLTLSTGNTWTTKNYLLGDESFAAGSTIDELIALGQNTRGEIVVAAVLFSDGTGDGQPGHLQMLVEKRKGVRDQVKQILPKLRGLASGSQSEQALTDLEAEAANLLTKANASADYHEGLEITRTALLKRIKDIKEQRLANKLADARAKEEKLISLFEFLASPSN